MELKKENMEQDNLFKTITDLYETLGKRTQALTVAIDEMQAFIDKVDRGQAQSKETYAKQKKAIQICRNALGVV